MLHSSLTTFPGCIYCRPWLHPAGSGLQVIGSEAASTAFDSPHIPSRCTVISLPNILLCFHAFKGLVPCHSLPHHQKHPEEPLHRTVAGRPSTATQTAQQSKPPATRPELTHIIDAFSVRPSPIFPLRPFFPHHPISLPNHLTERSTFRTSTIRTAL